MIERTMPPAIANRSSEDHSKRPRPEPNDAFDLVFMLIESLLLGAVVLLIPPERLSPRGGRDVVQQLDCHSSWIGGERFSQTMYGMEF